MGTRGCRNGIEIWKNGELARKAAFGVSRRSRALDFTLRVKIRPNGNSSRRRRKTVKARSPDFGRRTVDGFSRYLGSTDWMHLVHRTPRGIDK